MKTTYTLNGINDFHNQGPITLNLTGKKVFGHAGEVCIISPRQARRIQKHFCGVKDCACPGGCIQWLDPEGQYLGIPVEYCKVDG